MALERGKLTNVIHVGAGTTVGVLTVTSSKKVYVKSIIACAPQIGIATASAQVYFCPVGVSSGPTNKIFDVDMVAGETVMLEPSYPLVLDTDGDHLEIGTGDIGLGSTVVNFLITGDKEA
tara:strand:- start:1518 stop:1877 length:360 start_codon:yes stop_codon:yes gene_type:complete